MVPHGCEIQTGSLTSKALHETPAASPSSPSLLYEPCVMPLLQFNEFLIVS